MTSTEIMHADILDIIFENRNKEYGAYRLRKLYPQHLFIALISVLALMILIVLIGPSFPKQNKAVVAPNSLDTLVVNIREIELEKPRQPQPAIAEIRRANISAEQVTNTIRLRPDNLSIATIRQFGEPAAQPSLENLPGMMPGNFPVKTGGIADSNLQKPAVIKEAIPFIPEESQPEFPGGDAGLREFLASNLNVPAELEAGDRKIVEIRFTIAADGSVAELEIVKSAGFSFDREVMRVCRKMPRWKPAIQNRIKVPVRYIIPITFIGIEQ